MRGSSVKAIYIFMYMAFAMWRVFYNVYLEENAFSGARIGIINALTQVTVFIIVPLWGMVADERGIRPSLKIALIVSASLILFLGNIVNFWFVLAYILVLTIFYHPLGPLLDALAVKVAEEQKELNYGGLRFWGSFGWAIASLGGGFLLEKTGLQAAFPISAVFFIAGIFFLGKSDKTKRKKFKPEFKLIRKSDLAGKPELIFFLVILFLYGVASSPVYAFINLYLTELGADKQMIGLVYTIQALSELPFFIIGNWLLKRMGAHRIILISMLAMMIRFAMYGFAPGITMVLIASILQGVTLSFLLIGVVDYLHKQLPPKRHATAQSLLWGLYFGLGQTVGNLIIGVLKDKIQMVGVMQVFLFLATGIFLITAGDFVLQTYFRSKPS